MISFCCPGCRATFKLPDELAGKTARCSKCDQRFTVPATAGPAAETGQMAAAETATGPAKKVALKPVQEVLAAQTMRAGVPSAKPFDDVEVVNVVIDKVEVVEAEPSLQDPPRRSIVRDDDDDMPRRRRRRSSSGSSTGIIIGSIVGGLVFLAVVVVVIVLLVNRTSRINDPGPIILAQNNPPANPPNNPGAPAAPANAAPAANNGVIVDRQDRLTRNDPWDNVRRNCRAKRYVVQLEANKTYVIDMIAVDRFGNFDPYLRLEQNGIQIMEDDDGGEELDARIVFQPQQTGQYTIIATTFLPQDTGAYRLIVRVQ